MNPKEELADSILEAINKFNKITGITVKTIYISNINTAQMSTKVNSYEPQLVEIEMEK